MAEPKDPKNTNPGDDLLEGFDDAFDGGIDQVDEFVGGSEHDEKTEFYDKEEHGDKPPSRKKPVEKTEVVFKDDEEDSDNRTHMEIKEPDSDENRTHIEIKDHQDVPENAPAFEPTRNAVLPPKVATEDLASLFEEQNAEEGNTEGVMTYDAPQVQPPTRVATEDLSSLIEDGGGEEKSESFTENFSTEIHSEDVMGRSGSAKPEKKKEVITSDLSSLIEEEISGKQGKTEDLSSLIQSDAIEGVTDDDITGTTQNLGGATKPVSPPAPFKKDGQKAPEPRVAFEESISPMPAEDSKTIRVRTLKQKLIMGGSIAVGVAAVAGGAFMFLKSKNKAQQPPEVVLSAPAEKVVDSQELLKELDEKFNQLLPSFLPDRYQNYSEAASRLEEILNIYPNHQKANARLAEAILLKFDGYLDGDRKNRVYQLLEKADTVDANSTDTLRAKARSLLMDGKYKDATVRIQQALTQNANDVPTIQTAGEIQFALGDTKSAQASFSKAMELQADYVRSKYYYYLTLEEQGKTKAAKDGFMKLASAIPAHNKSAIERFAIDMDEDADAAKTGLQQFLTAKEGELSAAESGRGWKLISQMEMKKSNVQGSIEALEKSVFKMPLDAQAAFQLGNLYFRQNNFDKSSQHYSTAVTLDPEKSEYLMQLGISLREQGRLKESEENLKKLITKEPMNFDALYQHGLSKYKLGFVDDVIGELELNIKEKPGFLQGKILLGNIQLDRNDLKNSLKNFQDALAASKDRKVTKMALSSIGDYYARQEMWSKAQASYEAALQRDPDSFSIHYALAKIDLQTGDLSSAQNHLQKMLKVNSTSLDGKIIEANILVRKKEYDKAIDIFKQVIRKNDSDYVARVELSKVYLAKEQYSDAVEELQTAYRFNADYFYTYYYLGIAYRGMNDLAESERNLLKAISILPKFYKAHYELGITYLKKEDVKKGEEEMKAALVIQPSYTPALVAMGDYYYERNAFEQANTYYTQALEKQPKQIDIMAKQAKAYHELNNDTKAIALLQKILQIKPNSSDTYFELGILYEENNNLSQALKHYQRSAALNPKNPKPYYQLGFLYRALGQTSKAIQSFKTFLTLSPDAIERPDIEDQIQKMSKR